MSARREAEAIAAGAPADVATVARLAGELRDAGQADAIAPLLIAAARRAIYDDWEREHRVELAATLREHRQPGYARRLLSRVRREGRDSEPLRQQHALCTYRDTELPAGRRLDRALEILGEGERPLRESASAETLQIAGAIYTRQWEVGAKRVDLECARWCYERAFAFEAQGESPYAGIHAAFVADRLAELEDKGLGPSSEAAALRVRADAIRAELASGGGASGGDGDGDGGRQDAILGEALFGLGRFEEAQLPLARVGERARQRNELWRSEATVMRLAEIARLRRFFDVPEPAAAVERVLVALVGEAEGALRRAYTGKVGLALSGGGFRASLFHLGVLARLAECRVLRHVEALSCVSGGSILGAAYYLKLRELLQDRADGEIDDADYVELVRTLARQFLDSVRKDLRGQLGTNVLDDWRMLATRFSRTDRVAELLHELFYARLTRETDRRWLMTDLVLTPRGSEGGFSLRDENWLRSAKVPVLVLNATTLNTGHNWQFTATWMGEPPVGAELHVDASRRLRRVRYDEAPHGAPTLDRAVAASACVPGLFPPITFAGVYDGIDVELVDGGVHDNQGIASLLEQDCSVILVSDASGQMADAQRPKRRLLGVLTRSNSVLMSRVRGAQYADLASRRRSETLRGLMIVHLKKGLPSPPRDWIGCQEPYDPEDDALPRADRLGRSPYAIDEGVQLALAQLRTDLDAFSDEEAYGLMAAGYRMAEHELGQALPELAAADPLAPLQPWPFAAMLARVARDDGGELARALRPGSARFFRRWHAWRGG